MRNSDPSGSSSHVAYTRWRRLSTTIFPAMSRFKTAGTRFHSHGRNFTNLYQTIKRLRGLLNKNREILKQYDGTIQDQLKKGIIEPVQVEEPCSNEYTTCHVMQYIVHQDKATTKLRIVYDASAKSEGPH